MGPPLLAIYVCYKRGDKGKGLLFNNWGSCYSIQMVAEEKMKKWMAELAMENESGRSEVFNRVRAELVDEVSQFEWGRYAALLGVRDAIHEVIDAYQKGRGVEPSEVAAFEWIRKAAMDGGAEFYFELATAYRDGVGTTPNISAFWEWMTKSASDSSLSPSSRAEAMFHLAEACLKPEFGDISVERSVDWTRKMAEEGAAAAMVRLARQYRDGEGVEKSLEQMLAWSESAVSAANAQWEAAVQNLTDDYQEELTLEDRPEALMMLAEAYRLLKRHTDAAQKGKEAAIAADEAVSLAKKYGWEFGQKLPEVMLERIPAFKNQNGTIRKNSKAQYLRWLLRIDSAIDRVLLIEEKISKNLAGALYSIALAYKEGIGTSINLANYKKYLKKSAEAGCGEAAYDYVVLCRDKNDQSGFAASLAMPVMWDSMNGLVAKELGKYDLKRKSFLTILGKLRSLWDVVDNIRKTKHLLNQSDCPNGLAHYTDGFALTSMLNSVGDKKRNAIRLYSTAYVNDPKEGTRLQTFSQTTSDDPLKEFFPKENGMQMPINWEKKEFQVFIACFSQQHDSLDLWRFYGKDGKGFSVVTPFTSFNGSSTEGMIRGPWTKEVATVSKLTLYRVLYKDEDAMAALNELKQPLQEISQQISKMKKHKDDVRRITALIVSELLYLYKDESYANEQEVRAIEARALGDPILQRHMTDTGFSKLFVQSPAFLFTEEGSKIIVGPKVESAKVATIDIRDLLSRNNWNECVVDHSKMSYR